MDRGALAAIVGAAAAALLVSSCASRPRLVEWDALYELPVFVCSKSHPREWVPCDLR